ncbi:MAG: toxin-antitoxin system HicB family antitoxin [bacterium]
MVRFTLRIPDSLHHKLNEQAQKEGVSLNQYILFSLSRAVTEEDIESQRAQFEAMRYRYSEKAIETALQNLLGEKLIENFKYMSYI